MFSYGPPHMAEQKQDDQLEPTYSSSVMIWDVALRTYQKRWLIGRSGERGSGISVLVARHDDDDDIYKHTQKESQDTHSHIHREKITMSEIWNYANTHTPIHTTYQISKANEVKSRLREAPSKKKKRETLIKKKPITNWKPFKI